jgi:hypothetical protein
MGGAKAVSVFGNADGERMSTPGAPHSHRGAGGETRGRGAPWTPLRATRPHLSRTSCGTMHDHWNIGRGLSCVRMQVATRIRLSSACACTGSPVFYRSWPASEPNVLSRAVSPPRGGPRHVHPSKRDPVASMAPHRISSSPRIRPVAGGRPFTLSCMAPDRGFRVRAAWLACPSRTGAVTKGELER